MSTRGWSPSGVRQGERLQALVGRIAQLNEKSRVLGLDAAKVRLAYGLGNPASSRALPAVAGEPASPDSIYADAIEQGDRLRSRTESDLAVLDSRLAEVEGFERSHQDLAATTPAACPLKGESFVLLSGFGRRKSAFTHAAEFHAGLDLAAPIGTPVYAPADGTVVFAGQISPASVQPGGAWATSW